MHEAYEKTVRSLPVHWQQNWGTKDILNCLPVLGSTQSLMLGKKKKKSAHLTYLKDNIRHLSHERNVFFISSTF